MLAFLSLALSSASSSSSSSSLSSSFVVVVKTKFNFNSPFELFLQFCFNRFGCECVNWCITNTQFNSSIDFVVVVVWRMMNLQMNFMFSFSASNRTRDIDVWQLVCVWRAWKHQQLNMIAYMPHFINTAIESRCWLYYSNTTHFLRCISDECFLFFCFDFAFFLSSYFAFSLFFFEKSFLSCVCVCICLFPSNSISSYLLDGFVCFENQTKWASFQGVKYRATTQPNEYTLAEKKRERCCHPNEPKIFDILIEIIKCLKSHDPIESDWVRHSLSNLNCIAQNENAFTSSK